MQHNIDGHALLFWIQTSEQFRGCMLPMYCTLCVSGFSLRCRAQADLLVRMSLLLCSTCGVSCPESLVLGSTVLVSETVLKPMIPSRFAVHSVPYVVSAYPITAHETNVYQRIFSDCGFCTFVCSSVFLWPTHICCILSWDGQFLAPFFWGHFYLQMMCGSQMYNQIAFILSVMQNLCTLILMLRFGTDALPDK